MASKLINSEQFIDELKKEDQALRNEQEGYHTFTRNLQAELDSISREHSELRIFKVQSSKNL
jgi:FtsZ-binding cell division protein ZapB